MNNNNRNNDSSDSSDSSDSIKILIVVGASIVIDVNVYVF
jgi:hypothetical protein